MGIEMTRKLNIGGTQQEDGWEILNADPAPYVDHVCNATDMSQFSDGVFSEIYASHIVEHFDYMGELASTLKEWWRILAPGGKLYISVPDLDVLAELFISKDKFTSDERFFIMRMIFGGHYDKHDYHVAGLNEEFLTKYLEDTGYINITKVDQFGFFDDASNMTFGGVAISLNLIAEKPGVSISDKTNPDYNNIGRNDPCPCGSGEKFKKCHGKLA